MSEPTFEQSRHMVNAACIYLMQSASTWHQIIQASNAVLHVKRQAESMWRELDRTKREQGSGAEHE